MSSIFYPSKILLLGEYTILNGSKALAIPFPALKGYWSFESKQSIAAVESRKVIQEFIQHVHDKHYIRLDELKTDLERGLWFCSDIPQGHGLGSSGALIAAIFDRYGVEDNDLEAKKNSLARLEDYFHGSSSGLDPLVSLIKKPLFIHNFDKVEIFNGFLDLSGFFLINSGKARATGPLVKIYKEKMKDPEFKSSCAEILSREVNFAIQDLVKNERSHLFHHLWLISKFQWEYFPEMIPTQMRSLWLKGLESGDYILKLCGAGGGGHIIGYSEKLSKTQKLKLFDPHQLREISEGLNVLE